MSFTPTTGQVAVVKLTLGTAGAADWVGPGINWKLDIDPKLVDKSNFRDGRIRNKTLRDATLTMTLVYDQADSPLKAATGGTGANVLDGATGVAKLFVDATRYITVPVMVGTVGVENPGMEDDLMLDVTFNQSANGSNTDLTYPTGV